MNQSMINAGVTMNGLLRKLDLIANNVANAGTDGFKKKDATFEDVLSAVKAQHPDMQLPGRLTPPGMTIGGGARMGRIQLDLQQGTLRSTENPWDIAIEGEGFFEIGLPVADENGDIVYDRAWTRNGSFRLSLIAGDPDNGMLTTSDGNPVMGIDDQPIILPFGRRIEIDAQGVINAYNHNDPAAEPEQVGQLKLVRATRPQLLDTRGDNVFMLQAELDDPAAIDELMEPLDLTLADPDAPALTRLRQSFLEGSNVELTEEMTDLIQVQRAFQLNARALSSSDTMMNLANTLRS